MREEIDLTTHIRGVAKFLLDGWSISFKKVEEEVFQEAKLWLDPRLLLYHVIQDQLQLVVILQFPTIYLTYLQ